MHKSICRKEDVSAYADTSSFGYISSISLYHVLVDIYKLFSSYLTVAT